MPPMVKVNRKLEQLGFSVEQNGLDWFGRRGAELVVKRWRDDADEPGVLCRSLESERQRRKAVGKPARGLRTRCENAIAETLANQAPLFVVFAYRKPTKSGGQEAVWPQDEPLVLVRVDRPVYVDGAWLISDSSAALTVPYDAERELQKVLRKVRANQRQFAMAVFKACDGKCIITGCSSGHVIDAAHRPGRSWEAGHNTAGDGWMLRADIHRALGAGLIDIAEDGTLTRCDSSVAYIAETYARHTRSRLAERS